jgi:hypothetical protein
VAELVKSNVPLRKTFIRKRKNDWISNRTIKQMKLRNEAWQRYRQYRSEKNYVDYKEIRNRVNTLVREDHDRHQKSILKSFKGNPKKFYGYMRKLQTVKDRVAQLTKKNGQFTTDDREAAEVSCEGFSEVFVKEQSDEEEQTLEEAMDHNESEIEVNLGVDVVRNKLLKLKLDKSPGPDDIHPMVLSHPLRRCSCRAAVNHLLGIIRHWCIAK